MKNETLKVTDLMIGDRVSLSQDSVRPCRIMELRSDTVLVLPQGCKIWEEVGYEQIFPIPLTPEMLEKLGWIKDRSGYFDNIYTYCYREVGMKEVRVHFGDDEIEGWIFAYDGSITSYIGYDVHQLQHFLKDYGMSDLANNFKI